MRIVFIGTPDFAVGILDALIQANKNIVAVVTSPDKPAGRGKKIQQSAVKQCADANGIPTLQPPNLKAPEFLEALEAYKAELQIVVAFRMLPESVWNMPPLGTFNLHASLLPQYRGAAPINWAIINGELSTGVSTFFLKHKIDTGDILDQTEVQILPEDNAGTLHDKLMSVGADLVVSTLTRIEAGDLKSTPQAQIQKGELKTAPKIFKPFCRIDWKQPVVDISNKIRGLSPYPCAFTRVEIAGKQLNLKLYSCRIEERDGVQPFETNIEESQFGIGAANGIVWIDELQLEGKRRMKSVDFLRGISSEIKVLTE